MICIVLDDFEEKAEEILLYVIEYLIKNENVKDFYFEKPELTLIHTLKETYRHHTFSKYTKYVNPDYIITYNKLPPKLKRKANEKGILIIEIDSLI